MSRKFKAQKLQNASPVSLDLAVSQESAKLKVDQDSIAGDMARILLGA